MNRKRELKRKQLRNNFFIQKTLKEARQQIEGDKRNEK